jgi:hypothetical protein
MEGVDRESQTGGSEAEERHIMSIVFVLIHTYILTAASLWRRWWDEVITDSCSLRLRR